MYFAGIDFSCIVVSGVWITESTISLSDAAGKDPSWIGLFQG